MSVSELAVASLRPFTSVVSSWAVWARGVRRDTYSRPVNGGDGAQGHPSGWSTVTRVEVRSLEGQSLRRFGVRAFTAVPCARCCSRFDRAFQSAGCVALAPARGGVIAVSHGCWCP